MLKPCLSSSLLPDSMISGQYGGISAIRTSQLWTLCQHQKLLWRWQLSRPVENQPPDLISFIVLCTDKESRWNFRVVDDFPRHYPWWRSDSWSRTMSGRVYSRFHIRIRYRHWTSQISKTWTVPRPFRLLRCNPISEGKVDKSRKTHTRWSRIQP